MPVFNFHCSVSPPKKLFVEESPASSAAQDSQDQGMSIPVVGSSESFLKQVQIFFFLLWKNRAIFFCIISCRAFS